MSPYAVVTLRYVGWTLIRHSNCAAEKKGNSQVSSLSVVIMWHRLQMVRHRRPPTTSCRTLNWSSCKRSQNRSLQHAGIQFIVCGPHTDFISNAECSRV